MCGIVGAFHGRGGVDTDMPAALAAMHHRGPDAQTTWKGDGIEFGHTRLAIIDLSGGEQPMRSSCGRYTIVFNGEIYNFQSLRSELIEKGWPFRTHSDTEVLLALFATVGLDACLARLRGMFAFAVWDAEKRELSLARDRLGVKPLVYADHGAGFAFASEIGALRALLPELPSEVDPYALDHYFSYLYIPSPMTGFKAVRKLPPAHAMVVDGSGIRRIWRYWRIDPSRRSTLSYEDACEAVREKLIEATRLRMISDVPLGAFLSGGVDSALTVAAMSKLSDTPVQSFAAGFSKARFDERPFARTAAQHLGTDHHEILVEADVSRELPFLIGVCGEPFGDDSLLPTHLISRAAREHVTVALSGDGGDEAFGGYRRHRELAAITNVERLGVLPLYRLGRRISVGFKGLIRPSRRRPFPSRREDRVLYRTGFERNVEFVLAVEDREKRVLYTNAFTEAVADCDVTSWLADRHALGDGASPVNRLLLDDTYCYLPEDILFKVDSASMAASLECRSPFLDHELIELAASLPAEMKVKGKRGKRILRDAGAHWLPPGFLERRKKGFSTPIGAWLRRELADLLRERLLVERRLAPWIETSKLEALINTHLSGKPSNPQQLYSLLVAAEWVARI